ncbi:hypothetical protein [Collinsella aerofaciens]|uniref:hypothetical protein n=1 Tax=Collinsella aerofaciens TaxID=74426 RepID=UPI0018975D6E|nr:hypothetical protein [Collinsella aerofaciens]MDB1920749.1 hypothetical protein [Collinsella aerofaciens]
MAVELDLSMLPDWLRDMDDSPSVRPGADDGTRYGLTWCGSFTVHGLGFQAMNGTTTDFAMAWPIGNGAWQVLRDAYDIYDPIAGQDGYIETDDLNDIMRENGFRSLNSFTAAKGGGWRESLTRAVAARWCRERYSVPLTFIDGPSALSRLVSCATVFDPYSNRALVSAAIEREMVRQENAYNMAAYANARELKSEQLRSVAVVPGKSVGHGVGMEAAGVPRRPQDPRANGCGPKFGH